MAVLNMRYDGDEILRKKCKEVKEVDDRIREILNDMTDTLHATPNGAAIAANQVGILKRLVVIDMGTGLMKLVNPVIVEQTGEQDCIEGCLSFPEKYGRTIRPQTVIVKALDENGEEVTLTGIDEMAKCFCHELDHLDGVCFVDKVTEWLGPVPSQKAPQAAAKPLSAHNREERSCNYYLNSGCFPGLTVTTSMTKLEIPSIR